MNAILRTLLDSSAPMVDQAHGQPFVLGRAVRAEDGAALPGWPEDVRRVWLACVQMPDGTWLEEQAFSDREVFHILP